MNWTTIVFQISGKRITFKNDRRLSKESKETSMLDSFLRILQPGLWKEMKGSIHT